MKKVYASISVFVLASSLFASHAIAANDNKKLEGDWASVSTRICIRSNAGFDDDLASLGGTFRTTTHFRSDVIFDDVGSGTSSSLGTVISMSDFTTGVHQVVHFESSCTFDYTVNADNSFTLQNFNCNSTTIGGPGDGTTSTATPPQRIGQIGPKRNSYVLGSGAPVVETLVFGGSSSDQICVRHSTAVRK